MSRSIEIAKLEGRIGVLSAELEEAERQLDWLLHGAERLRAQRRWGAVEKEVFAAAEERYPAAFLREIGVPNAPIDRIVIINTAFGDVRVTRGNGLLKWDDGHERSHSAVMDGV